MGKIKWTPAVILLFFAQALFAGQDNFTGNTRPAIPGANPAQINPGCNKCGWDIYSSVSEDPAVRLIKALYLDGKYRLETASPDGTQAQIIIFDNTELYILNSFSKTAALYYLTEPENTMFLEGVFPGIGLKKTDRTVLRREKIEGRECDVVSYRLLKRGRNMYAWGTVTEWLDRRTCRTIRVESVSDTAILPFKGGNITDKSVKQTYAAGRVKNYLFMDKSLFRVPQGYGIIDMKKQYEQALEKQKGIKPGNGYKTGKITIMPDKGKK